MSLTTAEANRRRHLDAVCVAQAFARTFGYTDAPGLEGASRKATELLRLTEGERLAVLTELFRRYGVE